MSDGMVELFNTWSLLLFLSCLIPLPCISIYLKMGRMIVARYRPYLKTSKLEFDACLFSDIAFIVYDHPMAGVPGVPSPVCPKGSKKLEVLCSKSLSIAV
ncbi:hypothetical protein GGR51DRAFT_508893 [Nemania sp. FL0031]|nr:hypothetical protein GGR51DRAFT_508893 [Nemania sp. FL0031]